MPPKDVGILQQHVSACHIGNAWRAGRAHNLLSYSHHICNSTSGKTPGRARWRREMVAWARCHCTWLSPQPERCSHPGPMVLCHQLLLESKAEPWQAVCCPLQWWWQRVRWSTPGLVVRSGGATPCCSWVLHLTTASCTPNKNCHL